jgi:hypothetical protein
MIGPLTLGVSVFALDHRKTLLVAGNYNAEGFQQRIWSQYLLWCTNSNYPAGQQHYLVAKSSLFLDIMGGYNDSGSPAKFIIDRLQVELPASGIQACRRLI